MNAGKNTLHIDFTAHEAGSAETLIVVNGQRLGTVVLARTEEPTCHGLRPLQVFEAFGLDDISRGEFGSRAAAALSLMEV
jgi:hypothetical protein